MSVALIMPFIAWSTLDLGHRLQVCVCVCVCVRVCVRVCVCLPVFSVCLSLCMVYVSLSDTHTHTLSLTNRPPPLYTPTTAVRLRVDAAGSGRVGRWQAVGCSAGNPSDTAHHLHEVSSGQQSRTSSSNSNNSSTSNSTSSSGSGSSSGRPGRAVRGRNCLPLLLSAHAEQLYGHGQR